MGSFNLKRAIRRLWTKKGTFLRACAVALLVSFVHLALCLHPVNRFVENLALDQWFHLRRATVPPPELVIVAVDDERLERLNLPGHAILPRAWLAELLDYLASEGAKGVMLDFLFTADIEAESDRQLADSMRKLPTVIGSVINEVPETTNGRKRYKRKHIVPLKVFGAAAAKVVLLNFAVDPGGEVRHFVSRYDPVWEADKMPQAEVLSKFGWSSENLPGPNDFINFYGPSGTIPAVPVFRIRGEGEPVPAGFFRDKMVFVGRMTKVSSRQDMIDTPYGMVFGLEVHAMIAGNLLQKNWIRRMDLQTEATLVTVGVFFVALLLCLLKPLPGLVVLIIVLLGWCSLSFAAFQRNYFIPGAILVPFNLPLAYLLSLLQYYSFAKRAKEQMENVMGLRFVKKEQLRSGSKYKRR